MGFCSRSSSSIRKGLIYSTAQIRESQKKERKEKKRKAGQTFHHHHHHRHRRFQRRATQDAEKRVTISGQTTLAGKFKKKRKERHKREWPVSLRCPDSHASHAQRHTYIRQGEAEEEAEAEGGVCVWASRFSQNMLTLIKSIIASSVTFLALDTTTSMYCSRASRDPGNGPVESRSTKHEAQEGLCYPYRFLGGKQHARIHTYIHAYTEHGTDKAA